ncbi:halocyanin domain-containing protein [Halorubrum sp. SS5]|uniref:Halocyanin domain-containing protein n=1 Tax=Halorubrum salinarum TaxID=2739057 RepID=A0A7D3Y916_9EURY|nr:MULTISPECIES: halocyanin domain-containing protein [Halorubrum]QKG91485.1 halocyanin domain-containing protein [Halorubrum salinarum]TKX60072.1 halocyanin domain-containing protein [Halorubrum sp. SS7]TKX86929.1 halocyanin domain-containing protein [Halorubrum sp. SS5]
MSDKLSRRRYLAGTGAALTIGTLAGCSGGGDGGDGSDGGDGGDGSGGGNAADDVPDEIDEYLSDARMYEGTIMDFTGQDEVTVQVGAGDVGFAFSPAAIRIDSSTTVVWEWTGTGGAHNVASVEASESDFNSGDAVSEEGTTFEQSFDNTGIQLYQCTPHQANGMLGAIEVVEA